jgi:hypothetical protein
MQQRRSERLRSSRQRGLREAASAPDYADPPDAAETRRSLDKTKSSPRTVA